MRTTRAKLMKPTATHCAASRKRRAGPVKRRLCRIRHQPNQGNSYAELLELYLDRHLVLRLLRVPDGALPDPGRPLPRSPAGRDLEGGLDSGVDLHPVPGRAGVLDRTRARDE